MARHTLAVAGGLLLGTALVGCGTSGSAPNKIDVGEPLVITDMLNAGKFEEAQSATRVDLSTWGWNRPLHSGYMALDPIGNATRETFFVFSPAEKPVKSGDSPENGSAPVLVWLQGGPGASSLFGMFTEIGPFGIEKLPTNKFNLQPRSTNWNINYHLLFLDNPVGTGFSYTDKKEGYVTSHKQAGKDLLNAIQQFLQLFPGLRQEDLYITGESYAGKWVPAAAFSIHNFNKDCTQDRHINLKGISIGDGAMDPAAQFQGFGELLFNLGMIDETEQMKFGEYETKIQQHLMRQENESAFEVFDEMINGDFYEYGTYYANVTGMSTNYFNFELAPDATPLGGDFVGWLNLEEVRSQFHVGPRRYAPSNSTVEYYLKNAWMQNVVEAFVPLLENYKVLVYSGQNDVILGPPLTERFLSQLQWTKREEFEKAAKMVWRRDGKAGQLPDVAGYAKQVGNFTYAIVRGAGHMVPGDQPERALDLLNHFILGEPFTKQLTNEPTSDVVMV